MGGGLLFTAGLAWFFTEAWIFAVRTHTVWLIVLLTITSTIAITAQLYLSAVVIAVYPVSRALLQAFSVGSSRGSGVFGGKDRERVCHEPDQRGR